MKRIVVAGASRGIGAAVARHYEDRGCEVIALSRGPAAAGRWVPCDLSRADEIERIAGEIGQAPMDALLFTGGVWEAGAFTDAYRFAASRPAEAVNVLAVNLLAPILLTQAFLPALAAASGRVVLIGSLSGLDHTASSEVANSASKYGLRGAAQALHLTLAPAGVGVTVINPGNVDTEEVREDIASGAFDEQVPIPIADVLASFDFALGLSPASVVSEVNLAQMRG
ncbi:SDR family NAD(P)-dependent oxidoreductase [Tabrizicola sp.]|uniref:SDR family NAD(P)-dependent oxidoreductase n=1 Tax=Tabrizicola sp. TaxID=2005166 RepID=UPI00286CB3D5|nr:SDR family NAD(P)-dependent oxidoreductase [Tabrizicola sp.]